MRKRSLVLRLIYRLGISLGIGGIFWLSVSGQATPSTDESQATIYIVQRGDTLFRIALNYGLTPEEIALANNLSDPSNILVGQRLIIPIGGLPETTPPPQTHVVQPGETLYSIAGLYGATPEELASLNNITLTSIIFAGQILLIGDSSAPQSGVTITYVVEPGETLFAIAREYNVTMAAIQEANEIDDPALIYAGQALTIPNARPPQIALDLPEIVTGVDIAPLFFVEGQSGRMRLTTNLPATVAGRFLGGDLIIISEAENTAHTTWIAIPIYTEAGVYSIEFSVTPPNGLVVNFSVNVRILAGDYATEDVELPEDRSDLLNPAVEDNELTILRQVTSVFNPERYFDGPLSLPAAAVMSEPFGTRRSYNGGAVDRYHTGVDFAGALGTPILAAAAGRVVLADTLYVRGISIVIDHGQGIYTGYSHMSERLVQLGDFVSAGQPIGTIGDSGRATGAHLHWELWLNGIAVDPMQWVREDFS